MPKTTIVLFGSGLTLHSPAPTLAVVLMVCGVAVAAVSLGAMLARNYVQRHRHTA